MLEDEDETPRSRKEIKGDDDDSGAARVKRKTRNESCDWLDEYETKQQEV